MFLFGISTALFLQVAVHSAVAAVAVPSLNYSNVIRPLVIWHGLGDSYNSPGMLEFMSLMEDTHPGIFIHSVYLDERLDEDRRAGFFGDLNAQIANVSTQLSSVPELQRGFDAIGFSQGGQFLRAYAERYNAPPVHNLITFGGQHMGISDIPLCRPWDLVCQLARKAAKGSVYTDWAQENIVQAQYFRDPAQLPSYYAHNRFLAAINNEVPSTLNTTYARNLASLNKLVLVLFSADKTVVPKESSWFGSYAPPVDDDAYAYGMAEKIIPMRLQPLYLDDRIGLRTLDERGDVLLETCEGEHMQISTGCWEPLVRAYVGGTLDGGVNHAFRVQ